MSALKKNSPRVSILVITYNHAEFIAQCLDSLLRQQTSFRFEIILGEDGSTDGTQEICQQYAANHPDIIRLFIRDQAKKVYLFGRATGKYNLKCTLEDAKGEYFAFCDGDDYWTDDFKLQKQVDFMDANKEYSFCSTDRMILENNLLRRDEMLFDAFQISKGLPIEITKKNYFSPYLIKTNVILFRRDLLDFDLLKERFTEVKDIFIYFMLLDGGKGIIQPWNTSVYRIHQGGRWSALSRFQMARMNHHCIRGMYNSYLGEAESLKAFYEGSLWKYFMQSLKSKEWRDATIAFRENPVICLQLTLVRSGRKLKAWSITTFNKKLTAKKEDTL